LWSLADERAKLDLRLPVRFAITLESSPRYIGAQFFPHLNLDLHEPAGLAGWKLGLLTGPIFTRERRNPHLYEVAPEFATPSRPAYAARGGYGGFEFLAAASKRFRDFWVGGFLRYDTLQGAIFEESPLVKSKRYFGGGFAMAWILGESEKRVPVT